MHYTSWGDPLNRNLLVCVHGLTRNGRDFDAIGEALQQAYRVVCPDLPGRGRSSWLTHKADYPYPHFIYRTWWPSSLGPGIPYGVCC